MNTMICTHLKELYQLCESNQLKISSSELVRITCKQCDEVETCPSMLLEEYEALEADGKTNGGQSQAAKK